MRSHLIVNIKLSFCTLIILSPVYFVVDDLLILNLILFPAQKRTLIDDVDQKFDELQELVCKYFVCFMFFLK